MTKQQNGMVSASSFMWNTVGSVLSAASSIILLSCVTWALGKQNTGSDAFAFAFAAAQLFLTLGKFGVRSYQATDVNKEISVAGYFTLRVVTCAAMMLGMAALLLYQGASAGVILSVGLLKMVDAVEDVYHGQLQLNNKLDVAGKLLALRNLFSMVLFVALIFATKNLELTCWVTAVASLVLCVAINHPALQRVEPIRFGWDGKELKRLTWPCLPLFIGHFLSLYIYNVPKFAIEGLQEPSLQTSYSAIFMPAFAINLLSEFLFKPLLTSLAVWWDAGEKKKFTKLVVKMIVFIFGATAAVLVGTYFVGTQLLGLVFNAEIAPYRNELMFLMLGGGFGAVVYFLYNVLASMRAQNHVLVNYSLAAVLITAVAFPLVQQGSENAIMAASMSYLVTEAVLCGLMMLSVFWVIRRKDKRRDVQ